MNESEVRKAIKIIDDEFDNPQDLHERLCDSLTDAQYRIVLRAIGKYIKIRDEALQSTPTVRDELIKYTNWLEFAPSPDDAPEINMSEKIVDDYLNYLNSKEK